MRKTLILIVALLLAAGAVGAEPGGSDIKCTADTTLSFTTGIGDPVGPSFVDIALDGKAAVKFIWFKDGATTRVSGSIARTLTMYLRDYVPPRSIYFAGGPDSAVVDLVTATEVIVTR